MSKRNLAKAITLILMLTMLLPIFASTPVTSLDTGADLDSSGTYSTEYVIVQLKDPPVATYDGGIPGLAATKPTSGHKLDLNTPTARAYANYLNNQHGQFKGLLKGNAPAAQVIREYTVTFNGFAVKLNHEKVDSVGKALGVKQITPSYLYYPAMDVSPYVVGLTDIDFTTDLGLWAALGGHENAGLGMKIGIIDTGINQNHPFLTDNSLAPVAGFPKCDALDSATGVANENCMFTTAKVIVAKVFQTLTTSCTAEAMRDHGSHVAGTAAGVYGTTAPLTGSRILSGVAPKAYLGNYNVFPCATQPHPLGDATFTHDIMAAVEAAFVDGMDVVNLSIGGGAHPHDNLVNAINAAVDGGMIVAVAAGNTGPGYFSIESPGIAENAITAGGVTNGHYFGITVEVPFLGKTFGAAVGDFDHFDPAITATYTTTTPVNGCSSISTDLTGKIALIQRGVCTFTTKVRNAQTAGAIGVIVYNNAPGDPTAMGQDGTTPVPTIPAVMVSNVDGASMVSASGNTTTVDGTVINELITGNQDYMYSSSCRGPTIPPGLRIKPDVLAPAVNVYSSVLGTEYASFQGTSMATPHVAGAAALLKQLHPDWSPSQIKSALVNSAARPAHTETSVLARGGGRMDLTSAAEITATLYPVSISFGSLPPKPTWTRVVPVTITSVSASQVTYTLSTATVRFATNTNSFLSISGIVAANQLTLSLNTNSITLGPGESVTFYLTLQNVKDAVQFFYQSDIILTGGTVALRVPIFVLISPGSPSTPP